MDDSGHFYKPLQVQSPELSPAILSFLRKLPCVRTSVFHDRTDTIPMPRLFAMQTGPRGQREWKFYETVQHEKQAAAAALSTVGAPHGTRPRWTGGSESGPVAQCGCPRALICVVSGRSSHQMHLVESCSRTAKGFLAGYTDA